MNVFSPQPLNKSAEILVVGGGPAGSTAAMYAARAGKKTIILEGRGASRLGIGYTIENYPGLPSISSHELLEKFRSQARQFGAEAVGQDAIDFNLTESTKYVVTRESLYEAKAVILATGRPVARERMILGEERLAGQGVSYCSTCDGPLYRGLTVVAAGSSAEAAEEVLALAGMGCLVHWVPGGPSLQGIPDELQEELLRKHIPIHAGAKLQEVTGGKSVEGVRLEADGKEEILEAAALFVFRESLTSPLFIKAGLKLDHRQCLAVDRQQKTNLEGVFAAGDITCGGMQAVTAAGEGAVAALQAILHVRKQT